MRLYASSWSAVLVLALSEGAPGVVRALPQQAPAPTPPPSISRADATADLDGLFRAIENVHPHPYRIVSKESVQSERQRITAGLPDTMTALELWLRVSPLVASLGDGHTSLNYPIDPIVEQLVSGWKASGADSVGDVDKKGSTGTAVRFYGFPPRILGLDDAGHLVVTSSDGGGTDLRRGERLVSINGRNADALLAEWMRETSGDSQSHRAVAVADDFHNLLPVHSITLPYTVVVTDADGRERTVTFAYVPMPARPGQPRAPELFSYRLLEAGVGYMNFSSMDGDEGAFKKALAGMFRQLAAESVRTLIVDVRRNGGGYDELGNELLRYVTAKPYRNWGGRELKRSEEFRTFAKSEFFPPVIRWLPVQYLIADGRKVWTGPVGTLATWPAPPLKPPKRAEPFFAGPVCVLTGPYTFSAAVIFADTIKTHRLATLVGEETGGRPNMFSAQYTHVLPRSGLRADISAAHNIRANGDASDRSGVLPDIVVQTTAADIRDGRDPVIERARQCPPVQ